MQRKNSRMPVLLRRLITGVAIIAVVPTVFGSHPNEKKTDGNARSTPSSQTRFPRNTEDFDRLFEEIKNWGRWGADDQLGTLNLITDQKRKQASELVKLGRILGLSRPMGPMGTKLATDNYFAPIERTPVLINPVASMGIYMDTYKISFHDYEYAHLDALCHIFYKGKSYNGYPESEVRTDKGCTKLGVESARNGVVTRAILLDIPRLKNVPYLEPGTPVLVEDIEAWEQKVGVRISAGDAVLLRTGRWARRAETGPWDLSKYGLAGFHASVVPWLKARGVAIVGSDGDLEVQPSQVDGVLIPVHFLVIASLGMPILDCLDLEATAKTAAQLNRWEFMLSIAPWEMTGATGSPVNSLAIF